MEFIKEGDMVRVVLDELIFKKKYNRLNNKVGKVIIINESYQSPDYYVIFFKDTQEHISLPEYLIGKKVTCKNCIKKRSK